MTPGGAFVGLLAWHGRASARWPAIVVTGAYGRSMASFDLYSAVVTSVPFLLLGLVADTRVFGPVEGGRAGGRRFDALADWSALALLFSAFIASLFALMQEEDNGFLRSLAGYGLGMGALAVFVHVAVHVALLYRNPPPNSTSDS